MILRGNVTTSGKHIESWNILSTITVFEFNGFGTCGKGEKLMA